MLRRLLLLCGMGLAVASSACDDKPPTSPSPNCSFTVSDGPAGFVAAAGTEFLVTIAASASTCSWSASSGSPFITPVGSTSGTGDGTVRFTVLTNSGAARQGTVQVASRTILVNQSQGSPCQFTVSPKDVSVPVGGADVTVDISVGGGTNCPWTTTSGSAFVTVKEGASGTGNGRAVLAVAANTGDGRLGSATVAGHVVSMVQDSAFPPCEFVVTPSRFDVGASGLTGGVVTITKTKGGTCPWIANSTVPWVTVRNSLGEGTGTVTFDVQANALAPRGASIQFSNNPNGPRTDISQAGGSGGGVRMAVLSYTSEPGDFIGQGGSDSVTAFGTAFNLTLGAGQSTLQLNMGGAANYGVDFSSPNGGPLAPGMYERVARFSFQPNGIPGFSFDGNFRGCNKLTGRLLIATAQFSGTQVQRFHARFEQHCEGWSTPLRGVVWIDANGAYPPAIADFPPAPSAPVTTLSYVSDPGDFIGGGQSATITLTGVKAFAWAQDFEPSVDIRLQSATVPISVNWNLSFEGTSGSRLMPGTYTNATRHPFNAAGVPGLSISGNGRGCNTLTGSFVVTEAEYGPQGEVLRFHATFEQHCEGAVPALRGQIRIVADPWK